MSTYTDKNVTATRWYGRPTLGLMYLSPDRSDASITAMAEAIRGARLIVATRMILVLFLVMSIAATGVFGAYGAFGFAGVVVCGIMWLAVHMKQQKHLGNLRVANLNSHSADDVISFSRLNVALDDALVLEEAGRFSEGQIKGVEDILKRLPDQVTPKDASDAAERINGLLKQDVDD